MLPVETRNFARRLPIDGTFLQVSPLIACFLALSYTQLSFQLPVFPIQLENNQRAAFDLCLAVELVNLVPMQQ